MPDQEPQLSPESKLFGPNGRWLWFASGVFLVLIGVVLTALFNLSKPKEQRNDAIKWAAIGMAVGVVINVATLYVTGGVDVLLNGGLAASSSSQTSLF